MIAVAVVVSVSIGRERSSFRKSTNLDRLHASGNSHCGNGWGCWFGGGEICIRVLVIMDLVMSLV